MKRSTVGALALCGSLLLASAAIAAPSNLASLDITVVNELGAPVEGALVFVTTSRGETLLLLTDEEGHAGIEFKLRGNDTLELSISVFGGSSTGETLSRGDHASTELIVPMSRGYEWAWVD